MNNKRARITNKKGAHAALKRILARHVRVGITARELIDWGRKC